MPKTIFFVFLALNLSFGRSEAAVSPAAKSATASELPSDEELSRALKGLAERDPARQKRLLELRTTNPEAFSRAILSVVHEERKLNRLRAIVPANLPLQIAMWRNREKLRQFVEEYHGEADSGGRSVVASQIENLLGEQYDLRREMRLNRIKALEARLQSAKKDFVSKHGNEKSQFVNTWKPKLLAIQKKAAQNN